jgi:hypothetical protein
MLLIRKNAETVAMLSSKWELFVGQTVKFSYYGTYRIGVVTKITHEFFQIDRFVDGRFYYDLLTSQTREHCGIEVIS